MTLAKFFVLKSLQLQSLPSCSINLPVSLQNLPKFCAPWSSWCEDSSISSERQQEEEITGNYSCTTTASINSNDQPVATVTQTSFHVPPKYPAKYYQRKMPFRRKNWCGCLQVSQKIQLYFVKMCTGDDDSAEALQSIL